MKKRMPDFRTSVTLIWLLCLGILFAVHVVPAARATAGKRFDVFVKALAKTFPLRTRINNFFVELNGGVACLFGQHRCNDTYKIKTGHLVRLTPAADTLSHAKDVAAFAEELKTRNIKFLFVLNPYRTGALASIEAIPGDASDVNADKFLSHLDRLGVEYLDLRPEIRKYGADAGNLYFRTDNHWNFDGVMSVYPILAARFVTITCGNEACQSVAGYFSSDSWERVRFPRLFFGAYGRRTGRLFAPSEPFFYYKPKFNTEMSVVVSDSMKRSNDFLHAIIDNSVFQMPDSAFMDDAYNCYVKFHFARSYFAPIKKRLCIIDDSYGRPQAAWLTTLFERVWQIDLRRDGVDLFAIIKDAKPDLVAVVYNSSALSWADDPNGVWPLCRSKIDLKENR